MSTSYDKTNKQGKTSTSETAVEGHTFDDERHRYVADTAPFRGESGEAGDIRRAESKAQRTAEASQHKGLIVVQPLSKREMQPSYAQDLGTGDIPHGAYGTMMHGLGSCLGLLGAIPCCPFPNPFHSVKQGNVGLISRFGSFYAAVDPGLANINVCTESIRVVDVRIQLSNVPRQMVMTKDNVNVEIDSVICWKITSPYRATFGILDVQSALVERAQTTLRSVIGARTLQSVVTEREAIANEIEELISEIAEHWGVTVESILIKDIIFSRELQESLSSAAQAKRVGESKVIAARAEVDAAKLMRQAADILASPAAMSIRTLDALQNMARTAGSKVVFVPMNLSNMGGSAPGHAATPAPVVEGPDGQRMSFPQILEQADEGGDFLGGSSSQQAGVINSMASI